MRFAKLAPAMPLGPGPAAVPARETDANHDRSVWRSGDFGSIDFRSRCPVRVNDGSEEI